jgi:hypothetical protein
MAGNTSWGGNDADPVVANGRLWVGNMESCGAYKWGARICVTERPCSHEDASESGPHYWIPILTGDGPTAADPKALGQVVDLVEELLEKTTEPILLHCWVGCERSVLAATVTIATLDGISLTTAFEQVKRGRPIAANRLHWLRQKELYTWSGYVENDDVKAPLSSSERYLLTRRGYGKNNDDIELTEAGRRLVRSMLSKGGRYYQDHPERERARKAKARRAALREELRRELAADIENWRLRNSPREVVE